MGFNKLLMRKLFWLVLLCAYAVLFFVTHVPVYSDHYYGLEIGKYEAVYHLILRNIGWIEGGEYLNYSSSLDPLLRQLPYSLISYAIITIGFVLILILSQKVFICKREKSTVGSFKRED